MATELAQRIVDSLTLASLPTLPWRAITAFGLVAVYLAVDWKGLRSFYSPAGRLDLFKRELQELEQASFSRDTRDVLQEYGKADDIEGQIRR
jgi:hypothetical protein